MEWGSILLLLFVSCGIAVFLMGRLLESTRRIADLQDQLNRNEDLLRRQVERMETMKEEQTKNESGAEEN